jgi:DNA-binding CsgD family transcriptional regulator
MLYGREAERSRIGEVLAGARQGQSGVLILRGEAGVGKSALLEDARARATGMTVLSGAGVESEAQLPYAGLHQVLRPVLDHLGALPAPQVRALSGALGLGEGKADEWFLVSAGVLSLLAEAAEHAPLLVIVDDAQWLDDASAESLVFACRRLAAERIALLFAARDGDLRSFDAPGLPELRLGGLAPEPAGALLDRQAGVPLSPEARERLITETGGNPLALLALSSSLSDAQLAGAEPLLEPLPVAARIERVFLARVGRLPPETRLLLVVAAADDTGDLATVLPATEQLGAAPEALDAAEEDGLVRVRGDRIEFRHPLVRSAVYHGATLSRRRAAHRALASVLTGDADADRRAWHLVAGSVESDATVVAELERAARRARQRSGFVAASLAFERAAAMTADEHRLVGLLSGAAESALFAGRLDRAVSLLDRARPHAHEAAERGELDRWRGLVEVSAGVPADAREVLLRGAREMATVDGEQALQMLALACLASGYAGEGREVPSIAELAAGIPDGDGPVIRYLRDFVLGAGAYFAGDPATAAPLLRAALDTADAADAAAPGAPGLLLFAGGAGLFLGDDQAADHFNRRLVTQAREAGNVPLVGQAIPRLAITRIAAGQWVSAAADLRDGLELARQTGLHQVGGHMLAQLAVIAALRGDEEECRELAAESRRLASARRLSHVEQTSRRALAALELGRGDLEAALTEARAVDRLPIASWAALDQVETAARAGEAELAAAWLEPFERWAQASGAAWARGVAAHGRALLAEDDAEAERLLEQALAEHVHGGRPFERARTELALGELLRRERRRVEARGHLRAALDLFETLGAAAWAERAREELRASGQTARRRDPSTRDELSPQEVQIARYVARGLSNREVAAQLFLSPRTIDFHLRNVFRKLGITSRVQLASLELEPAEASVAAG